MKYLGKLLSKPVLNPQKPRRRRSAILALMSSVWLGLLTLSPQAHALFVDLNTSALIGVNAELEFSLLDGDMTANNQATISALATNGTLLSHDCSLGCVESAGGFTINDSLGLGQFLQDLTLGKDVNFNLNVSNNFAGGDPDRLVVSLLDPNTSLTLVSTNLNLTDATSVQDALLTVDFTGGSGNLIRLATASTPGIGVTAVASPQPWSMILPWALWLAWRNKLLHRGAIARLSADRPLTTQPNS